MGPENGDLPLRRPSHDLWFASPFAPRRNISAGRRLKVRDSCGGRPGYCYVCMHIRDSYSSERMVAYSFHARKRALSISQPRDTLTVLFCNISLGYIAYQSQRHITFIAIEEMELASWS